MICKNSSGKPFGEVFIDGQKLTIKHDTKPLLIINEVGLVERVKVKDRSAMLDLFDTYQLCIGEIAALYEMKYHQVNNLIKTLPIKTSNNTGRRNSSYGKTFDEARLAALREGHRNSKATYKSYYVRTPEIRQKISNTLKCKHASGEINIDPKKYSDAWRRGCYANAKMGRGIQGYFYSTKMNKDFYFRSLLELNYLELIETDSRVVSYELEPLQIKLSRASHYTPDILINDKWLIEFKPKDHLKYNCDERFTAETEAAKTYCSTHGLQFMVFYDTDIQFSTRTYKRYLRDNPDILKQFNIRFKDESRLYK